MINIISLHSGKTTFVSGLLEHRNNLIENAPKKAVLFYNEPLQKAYERFVQQGFLRAIPGPAKHEDIEKCGRDALLIFDDQPLCSPEYEMEDIFNYRTHHNNLGAICMVHNTHHKKFRDLRRASNIIVLMNNVRNLHHAQLLSREAFCYQGNILYKALHKLCSSPDPTWDQLVVNLQTSTHPELMIQSGALAPNLRRVYQHDPNHREGFRTGTLLKDGVPVNNHINNYNTHHPPVITTTAGSNASVNSNEKKDYKPQETNESLLDTNENAAKNNQEPEVFPGVPFSPDLIKTINRSEADSMEKENSEIKPAQIQPNTTTISDSPQKMSIDYTNKSRNTIQPESEWIDDMNDMTTQSTNNATVGSLNELTNEMSVSRNSAVKGTFNDPYLTLKDNKGSSLLATVDSNSAPGFIDSTRGSSDTSKLAAKLSNSNPPPPPAPGRDFTKYLSDTIINKPLNTSTQVDTMNASTLPNPLAVPTQHDVVNASTLPKPLVVPTQHDVMNETTAPNPLALEKDNLGARPKLTSIYNKNYARDDSFLPDWQKRDDVSVSLPRFKGLFQPRVYSSPHPGKIRAHRDGCSFNLFLFIFSI